MDLRDQVKQEFESRIRSAMQCGRIAGEAGRNTTATTADAIQLEAEKATDAIMAAIRTDADSGSEAIMH